MKVGKMFAVGLGLVALLGCETEEDDRFSEYDGIAEEEFVDRYAEAVCTPYRVCGSDTLYETCVMNHRLNWPRTLEAIDCRYWPEAAEACVVLTEGFYPDCEGGNEGEEWVDGEPCDFICYRPG